MPNNSKQYYIKNFYAGAYLKSLGISPVRIELSPKKQRLFFYDDTEDLRQHLSDFYNNPDLQSYIKNIIEFRKFMYETN